MTTDQKLVAFGLLGLFISVGCIVAYNYHDSNNRAKVYNACVEANKEIARMLVENKIDMLRAPSLPNCYMR